MIVKSSNVCKTLTKLLSWSFWATVIFSFGIPINEVKPVIPHIHFMPLGRGGSGGTGVYLEETLEQWSPPLLLLKGQLIIIPSPTHAFLSVNIHNKYGAPQDS